MKRILSIVLLLCMICAMLPTHIQAAEASDTQAGNDAISLIWPCQSAYRISAAYYYKDGTKHSCSYGYKSGIDITGGGNIVAVADGTIESVLDKGSASYGKHIIIRHSNGMRSLYAHLSSFGTLDGTKNTRVFQKGDEVKQGQFIGVMGSTGNSSGTHLHFEYEGGDPLYNFYKDKYKRQLTYDANCYTNNKKYNSDKWIVEWLDKYYELKSNGDYYFTEEIPEKPYNIVNTVHGVHVYWKAVEGITKYGVWRSETGADGSYTWLGNPAAVHFTDTTAISGKTYHYRITAMDPETGEHSEKSDAAGIIHVSTPDITSRANKAAGIQLGWNKISGATGYAIYRKSFSGSDAWKRVATINGNSTFSWTDTAVKSNNGTVYRYTIRALAGSDMKTLSGCRSAGRTMARLTSRTLNSAERKSFTSIKCSWSTTAYADGYEVRFMVGSDVFKTFTVGNCKTGTKTFTGLKSGQSYKIQVRSYKKVSEVGTFYSAWSEPKYVTLMSYELFLKQKGYLDDWDAEYRMDEPESYAILDINQDGDDELIILSASSTGFYDFLVYRTTILGTIKLVDCYSGDYGPVDSCWAGLRYSPKQKALVFSETRNGIYYGGLSYWRMEGDILSDFGGIYYEEDYQSGEVLYYAALDSWNGQVTKAVYDAYLNELVWIETSVLP